MPQSLANLLVHIVFSTKDRRPFLQDADLRDQMSRYLAGVSAKLDCPAIIVGGAADHVHLLGRQSRAVNMANWINELRRASSIWAKTNGPQCGSFQWQAGYGVFSVSQSRSRDVQRYIASQEEHHRRMSFQEEFRNPLKKHAIEFDEQYVWD